MSSRSRPSLAAVAGPILLGGFALVLVAGAAGAFAAGVVSQALEAVAPASAAATALAFARGALFAMIGALGIGLISFLIFAERRVVQPMRLLTRWAKAGHVPDEAELRLAGSFRGLAESLGALAAAQEALGAAGGAAPIAAASEAEALADALAALRRTQDELITLNRASATQFVETAAAGEQLVQRFGGLVDRLAGDTDTLSSVAEGMSGQLTAMAEDLGSIGATVRLISEETRDSGGLAKLATRIKPDLVSAVETLRAVAIFLERHVRSTQARLDGLVATAEREGAEIATRVAEAVARVERNADDLSGSAQRTGKKLIEAAEDFRRAGQIIAVEASSMRGALSDGVTGLKSARNNLDDLLTRMSQAPSGIMARGDGGAAVPDAAPRGAPEGDPVRAFVSASDEVLQLARSIERIEKRTTELARRAVHEFGQSADGTLDAETDVKTDETLAALMTSIERINSIAASISEAGDAASRRAMH